MSIEASNASDAAETGAASLHPTEPRMSYENAPATKMLATHCAVCARPLVDAVSVELGIGPDCRKKYGADESTGTPDYDGARALLAGVELGSKVAQGTLDGSWGGAPRDAANVLVHRIALEQTGRSAVACVNALHALGFQTLARRIAHRIAQVRIQDNVGPGPNMFAVQTPYSPEVVAAFAKIPGRKWDATSRINIFPPEAKPAVWAALRELFHGSSLLGPKGLFLI